MDAHAHLFLMRHRDSAIQRSFSGNSRNRIGVHCISIHVTPAGPREMGVFTTTMGNSTYSGFENEEAAQAFWLVSSQSDSEADEITPCPVCLYSSERAEASRMHPSSEPFGEENRCLAILT